MAALGTITRFVCITVSSKGILLFAYICTC